MVKILEKKVKIIKILEKTVKIKFLKIIFCFFVRKILRKKEPFAILWKKKKYFKEKFSHENGEIQRIFLKPITFRRKF